MHWKSCTSRSALSSSSPGWKKNKIHAVLEVSWWFLYFRLSRPGWGSYLGIFVKEPCPFQQLPRGWARVPRRAHLSGGQGGQPGCREALPPRRPREPGEEG